MRNIWLIRHAQSTANKDKIIQGQGVLDTDLTDLGRKQALAVANYFSSENLKVNNIYASDLKRANQTAQIIADKLNLCVQTEIALREAHFGKWEGRHSLTLAVEEPENYERWQREKIWRPSWCESFTDLQKRANLALNKILSQTEDNIIIVSHGGLMAALLASLTDEFGDHPLSHNCGISFLTETENKIKVLQINFIAPDLNFSE